MPDWYIYLVRCSDESLYTGITTDVDRRLAEHRKGSDVGAKYLRGRGPLVLVFQKKMGSRNLALGVESRIKKSGWLRFRLVFKLFPAGVGLRQQCF